MPLPFDATLKDLVTRRPADIGAGFHLHGPGPPAVLNVDLSLVSAATDVVLGFGDPPRAVVDLNFQSNRDSFLAERLLLYNALLRYRFHVPVHSLLVLLRPEADGPELTGRVSYPGQGKRGRTVFRYEIVRLWRIAARQLLKSSLGMVPLAVLGRLPEGVSTRRALARVIEQIQARMEKVHPEEARGLLTSAFVLTGMRVDQNTVVELYRGIPAVEDSTSYQWILQQGGLKNVRQLLLDLGEDRFGKPDDATVSSITGIEDLSRLMRMGRRLLRVNSWQELLRGR
jgi:hypothetical protein